MKKRRALFGNQRVELPRPNVPVRYGRVTNSAGKLVAASTIFTESLRFNGKECIMKQTLLVIILFLGFFISVKAQDTLILPRKYTCKIGIKTLVERSSLDLAYTNGPVSVGSCGLQTIFKIGKSKSSIESGLYYLNRATKYYWSISCGSECYIPQYLKIIYGNLHLPLNYRLDTRFIYFAIGVYFDYLLKTSTPFEELPGAMPYYYGTDRKLNFGWDIGVGFETACSKTVSLFAEAELNSDLTPAKTEDGSSPFRNGSFSPGFSNYGFAFGVNYKLLRKN